MGQDRKREREKKERKFTEIKYTAYPDLWDTMKVMLKGKSIALSANIKKIEGITYWQLMSTPGIEQKEVITLKRSSLSKTIKAEAEIKKRERMRMIQRIN